MVANKNIMFLVLLTFSSLACSISETRKDVIKASYQKMLEAEKELTEKIEQCEKFNNRVLSDSTIKKIRDMKLNESELRAALGYFSIKAMNKCETQEAWDKLVARTAETKAFEEYYKNEFVVLHESDLTNICCIMANLKITSEINYLKIDSIYRIELESIDELKEIFNSSKSAKKILNH